jgi:hypothetical protein
MTKVTGVPGKVWAETAAAKKLAMPKRKCAGVFST